MALCEGFAAMGRNDLAKPYLRANMEASCNDICNGTKSRSQVVMSTLIQMRQVFIQMKNNADELTSAVARYLNLTPSSTPIVRTLCFVTILKCEKKFQNSTRITTDTQTTHKTSIKSSYRSKKSLEMWKVWRDDGTCIGFLEQQQQQKAFSSMLLLNVYVVFEH